jgi:hypothetical protein
VADSAISAPRQPPSTAESGTAIAAETVAPIWIPVVLRGEEEPRERGRNGAGAQRAAALARFRAMRANDSTCLRASRAAAAGFLDRIASRMGTWRSAASSGWT